MQLSRQVEPRLDTFILVRNIINTYLQSLISTDYGNEVERLVLSALGAL